MPESEFEVSREPGGTAETIEAEHHMEAAVRYAVTDFTGMGNGYVETLWVRRVAPDPEPEPGWAIGVRFFRSSEQELAWNEERDPDQTKIDAEVPR